MKKHRKKTIKDISDKNKNKKNIEDAKNKNIFSQTQNALKDKINDTKVKKQNLENNIHECNIKLSKDHEEMPSKKRKKILYVILFILAVLDYPMNFKLLLVWRDDIFSSIILAGLFSLIIPITAHTFGAYLKKKNINRKDISYIILSVVSAIVVSWIVGLIRYKHLQDKGVEILPLFGYCALSFIIFIIGSFASYHLSFKNPEIVKACFNFIEQLKEVEKELEDLNDQINDLEDNNAQKNQQLIDTYTDNAGSQFDSKLNAIRNKGFACEQEYNTVLRAVQGLEALINSYFEEAIHSFRSTNESWRNDCKTPAYWQNPIEPLKMFFTDKQPKNYSFEAVITPEQTTV